MHKKGEISTVVILGVLIVAGVGALLSSTINEEPQTTETRAAGGCPIQSVSTDISGKICRITINFTPGNPEPAAPRNLTCALINPARDANTPYNQLLAGQKETSDFDYFGGTNVGELELKKEGSFDARLDPVPEDGNYRIVVYDFTNPAGCTKEVSIPASTVTSVFSGSDDSGEATDTNTTKEQSASEPQPPQKNTATPTKSVSDSVKDFGDKFKQNTPTPTSKESVFDRIRNFTERFGRSTPTPTRKVIDKTGDPYFHTPTPSFTPRPTVVSKDGDPYFTPPTSTPAPTPTTSTTIYIPLFGKSGIESNETEEVNKVKLLKDVILRHCTEDGKVRTETEGLAECFVETEEEYDRLFGEIENK